MAPITRKDVVQVQGRYLVLENNNNHKRFLMKGVEFPDAPPTQINSHERHAQHIHYDPNGWIAILQQLRDAMDDSTLNTVRLYTLDDPTMVDYSAFFEAAATMGFYVMVPLTATFGDAILNRAKVAPHCYTKKLWEYGTNMVQMALQHPNVVAGVIGNEVMNSLESWYAAPCLKAYARDLKKYMKSLHDDMQQQSKNNDGYLQTLFYNRTKDDGALLPIPLLYAAQDSGIGAALTHIDTLRLTVDYLSCRPPSSSSSSLTQGGDDDDADDDYSVDIVGVNFEAWCSSYNTFQYNMDGTPGSFLQLWQGLQPNVQVPLIFSELGCSHSYFNRDSPEVRTAEGTRDWTEVSVVLGEMVDTWSGYCAYAYWGNSLFNMMDGGPWNGIDVLTPTQDFINFQEQCALGARNGTVPLPPQEYLGSTQVTPGSLHDLPMQNGGIMEAYYHRLAQDPNVSPSCHEVEEVLHKTCKLELYNLQDMPSFSKRVTPASASSERLNTLSNSLRPLTTQSLFKTNGWQWWWGTVLVLVAASFLVLLYRYRRRQVYQQIPDHQPAVQM
jgi:Glucanosyltransferase